MFDHTHYVPLLRWKRGERGALKWLEPTDKASMTPLLELLRGTSGHGERREAIRQRMTSPLSLIRSLTPGGRRRSLWTPEWSVMCRTVA